MNTPTAVTLSSHKIFYFFVLTLLPFIAFAQQPSYKLIPNEYELEYVQLNQKEDVGYFNDVGEDDEGYIWVTGTRGINVYDGHNFVSYTNQNDRYPLGLGSLNENYYYISKKKKSLLYMLGSVNNLLLSFEQKKERWLKYTGVNQTRMM